MPSDSTTEKVLSEAARLIHRKGIAATSISDLQAGTERDVGIPMRTVG